MLSLLEEAKAKGKTDIMMSVDLVLRFVQEVGAKVEAGERYLEQRRAVETGSVNGWLLNSFRDFWGRVIMPTVPVQIGEKQVDALLRDAVARARASLPTTIAMPPDAAFEVAMISLIRRIRDHVGR